MIKAIAKIAIGGGVAQAIQFFALPVLSIIYSPGAMGNYFTATMLASIVTVLLTFQLQHAIPNRISQSELQDLLFSIISLALITITILSLLCLLLDLKSKTLLFWGIAFSFTTGLNNVIRSFLIRLGRFNLINVATFARAVFVVLGQMSLNYTFGDIGVLIGFLIGDLSAVLLIIYFLKANVTLRLPKRGFLKRTFLNQKSFMIYGTIQELVAVSTLGLPLIIVTNLFDTALAGQFGMAQRLILPPAAIILGAVVNVIHHAYGRREKFAITESSLIRSRNIAFFIFVASLIGFWGAGFVCDIVLSEKWDVAVWTSSYIAVWSVFLIASAPFRVCFRMYSKQHVQLAIDLVALLSLGITFALVKLLSMDYKTLVIIFMGIGVIQNFSMLVIVKLLYLNSIPPQNHRGFE